MYLEGVEVFNFRGLRHLSVNFESDSTVLIGENTWGKSSLLSLLWQVLGGDEPCKFDISDLYVPIALNKKQEEEKVQLYNATLNTPRPPLNLGFSSKANEEALASFLKDKDSSDFNFVASDVFDQDISTIVVKLIFCEASLGLALSSRRLKRLGEAWQLCDDGLRRVFYRIEAHKDAEGNFVTSHMVTNLQGQTLKCSNDEIIKLIIAMNPVLRMRDSRMDNNLSLDEINDEDSKTLLELTSKISMLEDGDALSHDLNADIETLNLISTKYLSSYGGNIKFNHKQKSRRGIRDLVSKPLSLESLSRLNHEIKSDAPTREKFLLIFLTAALFASKGTREFDHQARPIVILEDVEGRFHPSLLLSFWSIVESLPVQKIVTTNSCDLLTSVPLSRLRRLCRQYYDTRAYQISESHFNADDLRRIAFHIRINRPIALFARVWVLVEGETEMWFIPEIASILGYSLSCEGVRVVEFAQCGLTPLLKIARSLGIATYIITDGDEAGKRYAQTVKAFVKGDLKNHLLVLPAQDIEHYFFQRGYDNVFKQCAGLIGPYNKKQFPSSKIITQAIRKETKPGLALAVLNEMHNRGVGGVPKEMHESIFKIIALAKHTMSFD